MKIQRTCLGFVIPIGCALAVTATYATVLTFESDGTQFPDGTVLPQGYGDRVVSARQGGFSYGLQHGITPNVVVEYGVGISGQFRTWPLGYGDLTNVCWVHNVTGSGVGDLTLTADNGHEVQLHCFDMAGWPYTSYVIDNVQVIDVDGSNASNKVLFATNSIIILGEGRSHTPFSFQPPLRSRVLQIHFHMANLKLSGHDDNVGIDNIAFSQSPAAPYLAIRPGPGVLIYGEVGRTYRLDYSTQIAPTVWMPLTTNTLQSSPLIYADIEASDAPRRFYRSVEMTPP